MYRKGLIKIFKLLVCNIVIFSVAWNLTIWFDLSEKIASKLQSFYNQDFSNKNILNAYSPDLSKDPFGDAMSNIEDKSVQLKISWAEYVEQVLKQRWCNLSQKKIWGILYYFVPEFRSELARSLKQEIGDYDSKKYVFDGDTIQKYCKEYFVCAKLSPASPADVQSNCMEFFQQNYKAGKDSKEILQNSEVAQAWWDKYRNGNIEDSPYDIMVDLWILAKLLYQGAEEPIKPVFYNIPAFSNSAKSLKNNPVSASNDSQNVAWNNSWKWGNDNVENGSVSLNGWNSLNQEWNDDEWNTVTPLWDNNWWYDELVEWLNVYGVNDVSSSLYSNICKSEDDTEKENEDDLQWQEEVKDFSELSDEEYQEIVDYMLDAVNKYSSLPEDKQWNNQLGQRNPNGLIEATSPAELEDVANQIKNCWKSCEGLRIDQEASCKLKCACWEIRSPIFNPEEFPWLWPIFLIKFCGVPAVNTKFSVWWTRVHSIEEEIYEVYWVVDKLSREWRLWKWTQQYEFLDSSTKQMNMANTFAFSIDVEFVDISNNMSVQSEQYKKIEQENQDKKAWLEYWILNPLTDAKKKNTYCVSCESETEVLQNLDSSNKQLQSKFAIIENYVGNRMDKQWALRVRMSNNILDFDSYSKVLYSKKTCNNKKSSQY